MGTWGKPTTVEAVDRIVEAFEIPLTPAAAMRDLYDAVGDEILWDKLEEAGFIDPMADARPLIATHLEEMVHWSPASDFRTPWEPGTRARLQFIVEEYADKPLPRMEDLCVKDDEVSASEHLVAMDNKKENGIERNFVHLRVAPGVYALLDVDTDRIYRVECRYGLVQEIQEEKSSDLRDLLFPVTAQTFN